MVMLVVRVYGVLNSSCNHIEYFIYLFGDLVCQIETFLNVIYKVMYNVKDSWAFWNVGYGLPKLIYEEMLIVHDC